jgi:hypothetical protein
MDSDPSEGQTNQWAVFGFLFADLFAVLAMLFLIAGTAGSAFHVAPAAGTQPAATASPCGLDQTPDRSVLLAVADPQGVRAANSEATHALAAQIRAAFISDSDRQRAAGLVEVYGGSYQGASDASNGITLANGAIRAMKLLNDAPSLFTTHQILYQAFWDGDLAGNQVKLIVFFYQSSAGGAC